MRTEGREPVLVENKYTSAAPALLVSQVRETAVTALGRRAACGCCGRVRTPARLASVPDAALADAIEQADDFEWASWTLGRPRPPTGGLALGTCERVGRVYGPGRGRRGPTVGVGE